MHQALAGLPGRARAAETRRRVSVYAPVMGYRLVALAGPLSGTVIDLAEAETSLGRAADNDICVPHPSVSRHHCVIRQHDDRYQVADLSSRYGIYVNGIPVKEKTLRDGDRIAVLNSVFLFTAGGTSEAAAGEGADFADYDVPTGALQLQTGDSVYLSLSKAPDPRTARELQMLLSISSVLNEIRDARTLQRRLLELILQVVPAQRAAAVLEGHDGAETVVSLAAPDAGSRLPAPISRTVVRHVRQAGVAVLSDALLPGDAFRQAESLTSAGVRGVLCAPMKAFDKLIGVVYLDTRDPNRSFEPHHLRWVSAVAGLAAVALENVRHIEWLESETRRLKIDLKSTESMVGDSPKMREVGEFVARVAPTDTTVLIVGETGTGKELVARAIHANSERAHGPFVAVNCAALVETLLESELFGHERGAFTGATAQKQGKFELAHGGTLFLDEVGEIAAPLQAKLLRALQEHEFERVGGKHPIKTDIRLLAASNRDLKRAVDNGSFREDLYYRLNVVSIRTPPLRERREDIPLLVDHFVALYAERYKRPILALSAEARHCLERYDWPGNVRELQNAVERAVVMCTSEVLRPEDLPEAVLEAQQEGGGAMGDYQTVLNRTKKELILNAMKRTKGNYTEAAQQLGLHPNYLHRLIRNLGMKSQIKQR